MTLTELRYIIAVAKEQHFGRAADSCCVSQPTLSVAISKLEKRLNTALFERDRNQVRITDVGERIVTQAKRVLAEAKVIEEIASTCQSQLDCLLRIGAIYTIAPYLFPKMLPKLHTLAPNMPLIVQEDFTKNLRQKLQSGELDIALVAMPFSGKGLLTRVIYEEAFMVVLPSKHPLANKTSISIDDLANERVLLLGQGHCLSDQILDFCPQCYNENEHITVEGTSLETIRHMVASGLGITILPQSAAEQAHYQDLLCARPLAGNLKRSVALSWRASFPRPKVIDTLIEALK